MYEKAVQGVGVAMGQLGNVIFAQTPEQAVRRSQIDEQMNRLDMTVACLTERLGGLAARLQPITRAPQVAGKDSNKPQEVLVPLAEQLRQQCVKLEQMREHADYLLANLEL